ncbi:STRN4 protein, partial [Balaeniceps rex]|nr:STRN4 protein [Balaeniceps rex]
DPGVLSGILEGHRDAVWGLAFNPAGDRLAFCSTDGTVRIWDPRHEDGACLSTYDAQRGERGRGVSPQHRGCVHHPPDTLPCPPPTEHSVPASITFSATQPGHAMANQVVSRPSQPVTITARDDCSIRFLNNRTGWGGFISPNEARGGGTPGSPLSRTPGFPPLLAGHDCSLRLWHLAHKVCVQELTVHHKKHEEAVHAVAFHPRRALSTSTHALAKVFV